MGLRRAPFFPFECPSFFSSNFVMIFCSFFSSFLSFLHSDRLLPRSSSTAAAAAAALPHRHVPVVHPRDAHLRRRDAVPHEVEVLAVRLDVPLGRGLVGLEQRLGFGKRVLDGDAGAEPERHAALAEPPPVDAGAGVDLLGDAEVEVGRPPPGVALAPSLLASLFLSEALPERGDGGAGARDLRELREQPGALGLQRGLDAAVGGVGGVELADGVVGGAALGSWEKEEEEEETRG